MMWLLSASLALGLATPQVQPLVFRGGVALVPIGVSVFTKPGGHEPLIGLTVSDFLVVCEKKDYAPADVTHLPDQLNRYTIFFNPPEILRDGQPHDLRLKLKQGKNWKTLPTKWQFWPAR